MHTSHFFKGISTKLPDIFATACNTQQWEVDQALVDKSKPEGKDESGNHRTINESKMEFQLCIFFWRAVIKKLKKINSRLNDYFVIEEEVALSFILLIKEKGKIN